MLNPVEGHYRNNHTYVLTFQNSAVFNITLIDAVGRKLMAKKVSTPISGFRYELSLSNLLHGIYHIDVVDVKTGDRKVFSIRR